MDRFFLQGVVRELRPAITGARIRSLALDPSGGGLAFWLGRELDGYLVCSWRRDVSGYFCGDPPWTVTKRSPSSSQARMLKKWLVPSVVTGIAMSPNDRVVTLELEHTRLSGKRSKLALVLEILGLRTHAYLVDGESSRVLEAFGSGSSRLHATETYRPPPPPPNAAPPTETARDLGARLEALGHAPDRGELLAATGWTPLLVRELQHLSRDGLDLKDAFETVRDRLARARPHLYVSKRSLSAGGWRVLLSPVELESKPDYAPIPVDSFNDATARAAHLAVESSAARAAYVRLTSALQGRLDKARALHEKLQRQRASLADADAVRRKGETLLAGMHHARRSKDDRRVVLPNPFDPDGGEIELELDPRYDLAVNAERFFRRSKKVERTKVELDKRLDVLSREVEYLDGLLFSAESAEERAELDALVHEAEQAHLLPRASERGERRSEQLPPRRFPVREGVVLVGRSARDNEEVTFRHARPDDLWFHAAGMPGSHVVLKKTSPTDRDIQLAAGLAAWFSRGRQSSYVEVIVTERRHVSKIKGAPPGTVKIGEMRTLRVPPVEPPSV